MKKILVVTGMIIGLTVATALAQMGGGGGTGGQQPQQSGGMMGSQMMSQEMMRDMSGMMRQMNEMMQKLSHTMEHKTVTDHAMMQDMGKMMHEMAGQMEEMATHMEQGKMDQATVKKMHEKMQSMKKNWMRCKREPNKNVKTCLYIWLYETIHFIKHALHFVARVFYLSRNSMISR